MARFERLNIIFSASHREAVEFSRRTGIISRDENDLPKRPTIANTVDILQGRQGEYVTAYILPNIPARVAHEVIVICRTRRITYIDIIDWR